jgi:hypothetical protein
MTPQDKQLFGEAGCVNETGTTAITGQDFCKIVCLTETTFASLTDLLASGDALTGIALPAGTELLGRFSGFTLTSGAVRAYKAAKLA